MEYEIMADRPFAEIELQTVDALERRGFVVRRTFSLRSATGAAGGIPDVSPEFSILMLYASRDEPRPLGVVTLYERGGRMVIKPALTVPMNQDGNAELVTALILGGLEFCIRTAGGRRCLDQEIEEGL